MNDYPVIALLIDLVIAFTLIEGVALALLHRIGGRGVAPRDFALNMASGLFLMLALRCSAHAAATAWVALLLVAAGIAHGADLWLRWRRVARTAAARLRGVA